MDPNPYAPPEAKVADPLPDSHGLKQRRVIVMIVFMIIQTFRVKDMIEDHAEPETESGPMFVEHVKLSGLMTFFFSIFYLQWAINRYVVAGTQS